MTLLNFHFSAVIFFATVAADCLKLSVCVAAASAALLNTETAEVVDVAVKPY